MIQATNPRVLTVVLNYRTGNAQGSSGAVTRALGSGRPVAVSEAPVFDDVRGAVHTLRGDLATALGQALQDDDLAEQTMAAGNRHCEETGADVISVTPSASNGPMEKS